MQMHPSVQQTGIESTNFGPTVLPVSSIRNGRFNDDGRHLLERADIQGQSERSSDDTSAAQALHQWLKSQQAMGTKPKDLVINWHITEACNYACTYCYAEWDRTAAKSLILNQGDTSALLNELHAYSGQMLAPEQRLRLNLAGGEPLLYAQRCTDVIAQAHGLGMDVSIITNGSLLSQDWLKRNAMRLTVLGISLDSVHEATLNSIGRKEKRGGKVSDWLQLAHWVTTARAYNPHLIIKLNTVVNAFNAMESLHPALEAIQPDQWKVLQMLPSITNHGAISNDEFQAYVKRHQSWGHIIRAEGNVDMQGSYLMIDPYGRLFQNRQQMHGYDYSAPIHQVGFDQATKSIAWSPIKFVSRYQAQGAR